MQAPSISSSSDPESIGTDAWDPDRLAPGEASAPSAAEIAASESVRSATPPCQIHTNQSGETSQAHAAPPLIFQHFDPVPATITPSTGPGPGDDDPDALQGTTSSATLSHPLEGNKQQDTVTPCIAPDITKIQFINNPIPRSTPTASPTVAVSDSPSSPILLPAHYSDVTTAEPPLFVNPAPIHSDQIAHAFQSPPSPRTTASSHDTHDPNLPIPMTALLNSGQTAPPAHDIAATTSQPDEKVQHGLDKS